MRAPVGRFVEEGEVVATIKIQNVQVQLKMYYHLVVDY